MSFIAEVKVVGREHKLKTSEAKVVEGKRSFEDSPIVLFHKPYDTFPVSERNKGLSEVLPSFASTCARLNPMTLG